MSAMTATEKKSLEKLIDGDFDIVVGEIENMAARARAAAEKAVREEYAARDDDVVTAQAEFRTLQQAHEDSVIVLTRKLAEDREALFSRWKERGLDHLPADDGYGRKNSGQVVFRPAGLEEAVKAANEEVSVKLRQARQEIATRRSAAHRTVLLGGLESPQALALVQGIPKAEDVFAALSTPASVGELAPAS